MRSRGYLAHRGGSTATYQAEKQRQKRWNDRLARARRGEPEPERKRGLHASHIQSTGADCATVRSRRPTICRMCTNMPWLRPADGCPLGPLGCGLPWGPEPEATGQRPILSSMPSEPRQ